MFGVSFDADDDNDEEDYSIEASTTYSHLYVQETADDESGSIKG